MIQFVEHGVIAKLPPIALAAENRSVHYCPIFERPLSLGQKVKLKRTYAGIGYEQLADKRGIGANTILRWEESMEEPTTAKVKNALERPLHEAIFPR